MGQKANSLLYNIVDGPTKEVLFACCMYAYGDFMNAKAQFKVTTGAVAFQVLDVQIHGIEHEDASGHCFNLHGYCDISNVKTGSAESYEFSAYYDSQKKGGCITLTRR